MPTLTEIEGRPEGQTKPYPFAHILASYPEDGGADMLAELLGVSPRTIFRYAITGVDWDTADEIACKLGWHPNDLWPSYIDDAPLEDEQLDVFFQVA